MDIPAKSALLRLYTDERARNGHRALFEEIVCKARDFGVAGATVLRGPMEFGNRRPFIMPQFSTCRPTFRSSSRW